MYRSLILLWFTLLGLVCKGQPSFIMEEGRSRDKIKFELINNLIIIPVELNGIPLSFLLDTGVNTTVLLSLDAQDSLDLNWAQRIQLRGLGGEALIDAFRSPGNNIRIGNAQSQGLELFVIYDEAINFSPRLGVPVHGIIGTDFFKDFIVEINYQHKFLRIHDPARFRKRLRNFDRVDLDFYQQKPYVEVDIHDQGQQYKAHLLIDNGLSEATWLFPESLGMPVPDNAIDDFLGLGLLGDVMGKRSRVHGLKIGSFLLPQVTVSFPDTTSVKGLQFYDERNGSLGSEILRRFHVVFDYGAQAMYLRKNAMFREDFHYDMSGIVLEHSGFVIVETFETLSAPVQGQTSQGEKLTWTLPKLLKKFELQPSFKIVRLRPDSPAMRSGLQVGDEILEVNGRNAYKYSLRGFTSLFSSKPGKKIKLLVSRGGQLQRHTFRLEKVL